MDPDGDRQPCRTSERGRFEREYFVCTHQGRMPSSRVCRTNARAEVAATPNYNSIIGKPQPQTTESNFDTRGRFIVAGEQIRHPHSVRVDRATSRTTKIAKARPPQILP